MVPALFTIADDPVRYSRAQFDLPFLPKIPCVLEWIHLFMGYGF